MGQSQPCHNLPVYTVSGQHLGRITDVEVAPDGTSVVCYQVAPPLALTQLWRNRLIIRPAQVVQVTEEGMIVEDAVVASAAKVDPGLAPEAS